MLFKLVLRHLVSKTYNSETSIKTKAANLALYKK